MELKKIKKFYYENKTKIIIGIIIFVLLCISVEFYLFYNEKIEEKDLTFDFLQWSEYCDGRNYTFEEKTNFCNSCFNNSNDCKWPLDMQFQIDKVKRTVSTNGEVHCFLIIDGVDYYKEKGSFYGLTEQELFTWEKLDAAKSHVVEFCCGIQRESLITSALMLEKPMKQACVEKEVTPRCTK